MSYGTSEQLEKDFNRLNEQQREIITRFSKNSLVVAGPGTGKTRTISVLIAKQLEKGIRLKEILALTFSDKAATELRERVLEYYPQSFDQCWISTFHSFCARILREQYYEVGIVPDFKLLTGFKEALLMATICNRQQPEAFKEYGKVINKRGFQQEVLTFISLLKSNLIETDEFEDAIKNCPDLSSKVRARLAEILNLFRLYEKERLDTGYLDFRDLIRLSIKALQNPRIAESYRKKFKVILVDEFQDTDPAQFLLLSLLKGEDTNIKTAVIGDPRQSIYRFRGADPSMMTSDGAFYKKYKAKVFPLGKNYRSAQSIIRAATSLKWQTKSKTGDTLEAQSSNEGFVKFYKVKDEQEEARLLGRKIASLLIYGENGRKYKASDVAILVRNNYQIDLISENLQTLHIPYQIAGDMKFFRAEEVLAMASLFKTAAITVENEDALQRAFSSPVFGINPLWAQAVLSDVEALKYTMSTAIELMAAQCFDRLPYADDETRKKATNFAQIINNLKASSDANLAQISQIIIESVSGLLQNPSDASSRNILLFRNMLTDYCEVFSRQNHRDAKLADIAQDFDEWLSYYASTIEESKDSEEDAVKIMTVHQSKGLEFPITVVSGVCEGQFPVNIRETLLVSTSVVEKLKSYFNSKEREVCFFNPYPSSEEEHLEEERRLFFVAITRAKEGLILTTPTRIGTDPATPAPFFREMGLKPDAVEQDNRILTVGEFRTAITSLEQEDLLKLEPTLIEVEKQIPKEYAIHGIRPRIFNKAQKDSIELPEDFTFSASSLKTYLDCPRKFFFQSILGITNPLEENQSHFVVGNAYHKVLEELHRPGSIWEQCKKPTEEDVMELFDKYALPMLEVIPFFERYQKICAIKEALKRYINAIYDFEELPCRHTKGVEDKFSFNLGGSRITGRFDRIALLDKESVQIVDYKTTSSNPPNSEKIFNKSFPESGSLEEQLELQMPIYLLACQNMGFKNVSAALLYVMSEQFAKGNAKTGMQAGYLRSAAINYGCGPLYGHTVPQASLDAFKERLEGLITQIKEDRTFKCNPSTNEDARTCRNKDCSYSAFCQIDLEAAQEKSGKEAAKNE